MKKTSMVIILVMFLSPSPLLSAFNSGETIRTVIETTIPEINEVKFCKFNDANLIFVMGMREDLFDDMPSLREDEIFSDNIDENGAFYSHANEITYKNTYIVAFRTNSPAPIKVYLQHTDLTHELNNDLKIKAFIRIQASPPYVAGEKTELYTQTDTATNRRAYAATFALGINSDGYPGGRYNGSVTVTIETMN